MGGVFSFNSTHSYPCQICGDIFKRELSGSLLCRSCRILNQFEQLQSFHKDISVLSCVIYPRYEFVKDKKPFMILTDDLDSGFCTKEFWKQVKDFFVSHQLETKRNKLIKHLIIHIDKMGLFTKYKGIYIHTLQSNDLLSIHHTKMEDDDRIIHLNLDSFEKKILENKNLDNM